MTTRQEPVSSTTDAAVDPQRWWALVVIAAATLMVVLDTSIINLALPRAQADLGMSDATRGWVITAYTLTFGGLLLVGGRIADLLGRRRIFIIGLLGFAAASTLGGIASTAGMLFAARALQGAFAALLAPAALSLISITFTEDRERAKAFGVYGAIAGGGGAVGLIMGGVLTEYTTWRWCLFVNVPIAVIAALAALHTIPRVAPEPGPRRYDVPGAITVTAGSLALVYGLTRAGEGSGWLAPGTLGLLAAAVILLAIFVLVELRSPHPLLPLQVVRDRVRGGSFVTSTLISAGMFAMFLFLAYYLQLDLGYSAVLAGLAILPFSIGLIASATAAARLLPRFGPRPLLVGGGLSATLAMVWLAFLQTSSGYVGAVLPAMVVMGVGLGLVFVPLSSVALAGVRPEHAGVASALLNATQQIGGAIGVALLNTLYTASQNRSSAAGSATLDAHLAGYRLAFTVSAVLFAAAVVVITIATHRPHRAPALPAYDIRKENR